MVAKLGEVKREAAGEVKLHLFWAEAAAEGVGIKAQSPFASLHD
jgi:hypothetical protein